MTIKTLARIAGLAVVFSSVCAFAQGGRFDAVAILDNGRVAKNATIRVCQVNSTGTPCSPLATIYSNRTLTTTITQPFTADSVGRFGFYATQGVTYDVQISGTGITTYNMKDVPIGPASGTSTTNLTINGDSVMTAAPHLECTGFYPGNLTNVAIAACYASKPVTVTTLVGWVLTAGAGCTTAPTVRARNGGNTAQTANLTIANGANQNTLTGQTLNIVAGDVILLEINTAPAGCTTTPANLNLAVEYRMQ